MSIVGLLLIPLAAAALMAVIRRRAIIEIIHTLSAAGSLGVGYLVALRAWRDPRSAIAGLDFAGLGVVLRVDALSALMVVLVTTVGGIAAIYSLGYLRADAAVEQAERTRTFFALFQVFIFTMLLAVTTDNLGVMWVAIEGTTLATVFLVNLHNTQTSLEAAYKYLIISSVGIVLAFIGTVLMYYAGVSRAGEIAANWTSLRAAAASLNPQVVRLAFAFVLIGYGTKAGLAPMHTWLPDAHSEAPAPISALMSGVLLNVGLYALLRFKAIADIATGPVFAARCLLGMGLLSLLVAAAFLVAQRNYKRMLAYSSVEHMGIICLGLGFGGYWGVLGSLLHVVNHGLSKSLLFMVSGNILRKYRTTEIRRVRGLLRAAPAAGGVFLAGTLALVGLPPFGLFVSEFMIFRAGFDSGPPWIAAVGVGLVVVVFAGMIASVNQMLYGEAQDSAGIEAPSRWSLVPLSVNLGLLLLFGLTLPRVVVQALEQALRVLGVEV